MADLITNLQPATELEAVNAMLSAIGEAPVSTTASTQPDVVMALNALRNATREVQSMGWKFNTEFGYALAPAASLAWTDTTPLTTTLNIFTVPNNMVRFSLTKTSAQALLDVIVRPSRFYNSPNPVLVFYDRKLNRDGFKQADFPYLYINPVWMFDFAFMPEEARRFAYVRAARLFVQEQVGSDTLAQFKDTDEKLAYRNLKNAHGQDEDYNMNVSVSAVFGRRPYMSSGFLDTRSSPNHT